MRGMGNTHSEQRCLADVGMYPREKMDAWFGVCEQVWECRCKPDAERIAHEAGLEAQMRALRKSDPDLCVALDAAGQSLMHLAAQDATTEGLVRCVWECCGKRALQVMRHRTNLERKSVLLCLAMNPNMTRGMYAVFAEHCTDDDLRAGDKNGCTVLYWMAHTFGQRAEAAEQLERGDFECVMCDVVQRLGPGALLAESAFSRTPSSVLHDMGETGCALLQRLEAAAALGECAKTEQDAGDAGGSVPEHAQSAADPAPTAMLPASAPAPSAPASGATTDVDNSTARVV